MLTENEFLALNHLRQFPGSVQRDIADSTTLSLGSVNSSLKLLQDRQYIQDMQITQSGISALEPYKINNAVILAAGMSSRFVPLSYEKPKGTLVVRGEVLIERTIRQLHEVGITDITVVVGYKQEQYFYLEDKFQVKLVINEDFQTRNNNYSIHLVREALGNTYILASDNYFVDNVFENYAYKAFYSSVFMQGPTDEWALRTGPGKRINKVTMGGQDEWVMMGHAYFDREFTRRYLGIQDSVLERTETRSKLWEEIFLDHVSELDMDIRKYPDGVIFEFDSLDDVRQFDESFVANINSDILDNICRTLSCEREDIHRIAPLLGGLSNYSFYFEVHDKGYVYRHPSQATQGLVNRAVEAEVQKVAQELGLDRTFVYMDPVAGWKITEFITVSEPFDYSNDQHVEEALKLLRRLHASGRTVDSVFNIRHETAKIREKLIGTSQLDLSDLSTLDALQDRLDSYVSRSSDGQCLCHNDFYNPNILVAGSDFYLIDWEYASMSNYASDLGTFICCSTYGYDQALKAFELYFGRVPTREETIHCLAYVSLCGYYWFMWGLNMDAHGETIEGDWMHRWYRAAVDFGAIAENMINDASE